MVHFFNSSPRPLSHFSPARLDRWAQPLRLRPRQAHPLIPLSPHRPICSFTASPRPPIPASPHLLSPSTFSKCRISRMGSHSFYFATSSRGMSCNSVPGVKACDSPLGVASTVARPVAFNPLFGRQTRFLARSRSARRTHSRIDAGRSWMEIQDPAQLTAIPLPYSMPFVVSPG